jgi:hypothetical protein
MLSLAGDIPERAGVGDGEGVSSGARTLVEVRADPAASRAAPPLAAANVFIDKPTRQTSAHVRVAIFLWGRLGIIPSSGDFLNSATRPLEMPEERTFKARAAQRSSSVFLSKVNKANARVRMVNRSRVKGRTHANNFRIRLGQESFVIAFPAFQEREPER